MSFIPPMGLLRVKVGQSYANKQKHLQLAGNRGTKDLRSNPQLTWLISLLFD